MSKLFVTRCSRADRRGLDLDSSAIHRWPPLKTYSGVASFFDNKFQGVGADRNFRDVRSVHTVCFRLFSWVRPYHLFLPISVMKFNGGGKRNLTNFLILTHCTLLVSFVVCICLLFFVAGWSFFQKVLAHYVRSIHNCKRYWGKGKWLTGYCFIFEEF